MTSEAPVAPESAPHPRVKATFGESFERIVLSDAMLGVWLLLLAGFVDVVGFIVLKGSFVAFMSGNTTILASAGAFGDWKLVGLSVLLLALFFFGCVAGASLVRWFGRAAHRTVMLLILLITLASAIWANFGTPSIGVLWIALVGGLMSSALPEDTNVKVGLSYVTGTLVKAAHALVSCIGTSQPWAWLRVFGFWATFAVGAGLGGLVYARLDVAALWVAVGFAVVAYILSMLRPMR